MRFRMTSPIFGPQLTAACHAVVAVVVVVAAVTLLASCGDNSAAADPARFCEINAELEQLEDFTTASPDEARELVDRTRQLLAGVEETAPEEIRSAVRATAESFSVILDFYADADFDVDLAEFEAALESGALPFDPPEAAAVFEWIDKNCSGS